MRINHVHQNEMEARAELLAQPLGSVEVALGGGSGVRSELKEDGLGLEEVVQGHERCVSCSTEFEGHGRSSGRDCGAHSYEILWRRTVVGRRTL